MISVVNTVETHICTIGMSSEPLECVFIPPKFRLADVISIAFSYETVPDPLPSLKIRVDETSIDLVSPENRGPLVFWRLDDVCDPNEIFPDVIVFDIITDGGDPVAFDLEDLVFFGPTATAEPPLGICLVECLSGIYGRPCDYDGDSVTFSVDSIATLDYENVAAIEKQLDELAKAHQALEDCKIVLEIGRAHV